MDIENKKKLADEILGRCGKMVGGSKSGYRGSYPNNLVVFNANICTGTEKIWYGDVDVTLEYEKIIELATTLKETIYVLHESAARFDKKDSFTTENFVYLVVGLTGHIELGSPDHYYLDDKKPLFGSAVLEYNKRIFIQSYQFTDMCQFLDLNSDDPYIKFFDWIKEKCDVDKSMVVDPMEVYICKSDDTDLSVLYKAHIHATDSYLPLFRLDQQAGLANLCYGPGNFYKDRPNWAQDGFVYITENAFKTKEEIDEAV